MSEERYYEIPHNFYDDQGRLIDTRNLKYHTNITDSTVFIHTDVIVSCHSEMPHSCHRASGTFNPADHAGRRIVFEDEKLGYVGDKVVPITGYDMECNGSTALVKFHRPNNGGDIQVAVPVNDHPFVKK